MNYPNHRNPTNRNQLNCTINCIRTGVERRHSHRQINIGIAVQVKENPKTGENECALLARVTDEVLDRFQNTDFAFMSRQTEFLLVRIKGEVLVT